MYFKHKPHADTIICRVYSEEQMQIAFNMEKPMIWRIYNETKVKNAVEA